MNSIQDMASYIYRRTKVALALLFTQYALMLEYRAEIALWAISGILPLIMLSIWHEAGISDSLGFNDQWLTRYFISAFIVRQFTAVWVMVSFEEDNLEGRLSPFLLQPLMPFWRYFYSHIAEQMSRIPIVFLMLLVIYTLIPGSLWFPGLFNTFIFIFAVFLSFSVRFLLHWMFAMICFWSDRASSLERLLLIPYIFLSGLVAPLEAFPDPVVKIALFTPFPYILSFPSMLLAGQNVNLVNGFSVLILWGIILYTLSYFFWVQGIKHYSGMGA